MSQWALLKGGEIVNVVTTTKCLRHMQEHHPDFEVRSLYSVPEDVLERYQYYRERP